MTKSKFRLQPDWNAVMTESHTANDYVKLQLPAVVLQATESVGFAYFSPVMKSLELRGCAFVFARLWIMDEDLLFLSATEML